ncbi:homeobox protein CDX-1 isoform X2 [Leptopilina boulardi]|uniref:homeobox protein CDX-1 isoform X2 n=1 Tax=Leptopilina boulardi TaxID=63433 RepID=UPI0021F57179|nr:homeobox protein CDX-1 isoform X2 [Leptopilina boulardi]
MLTYNSLAMYRQQQQQQTLSQVQHSTHNGQQHGGPDDAVQQYWYGYPHGHHQSAGSGPQQYLNPSDVLTWPHTHHYSHLQYQHHHHHHHQSYQQHQQQQLNGINNDWSGDEGNGSSAVGVPSEPSPPITISGSEISSPGTPATPPINNNSVTAINNNNNNGSSTPVRPGQIRSPYEWMKKPSYQTQPNPGKTRTKDKYRVVYTDHQRLELEKEFHYSRYITIRRKAELAANLALSERQVKIWFQNRRAKERKQSKKREELEQKDIKPTTEQLAGSMASLGFAGMSSMLGNFIQNGGSPPLTTHPLALGTNGLQPHHHAKLYS